MLSNPFVILTIVGLLLAGLGFYIMYKFYQKLR